MQKHLAIGAAVATALLAHAAAAQTTPATQSSGEYRIIGAGITGASRLNPDAQGQGSPLDFTSSDDQMNKAFAWAKAQAMAYARDAGDPVGPWIEGGEPGRESFCMRDMSHQAFGAHVLGLDKNIENMMHRFAENIAASRDWCSYWGMTRQNLPRRVDYRDDAHFWYCLPANFDVLDCCWRMYLWSGDERYMSDPVFLNFYDRTMHEYVERWGLAPDQLLERPRLLNVKGIFDPTDKFQKNRGIPGYDEQTKDYTVGLDLFAKEWAATRDYVDIEQELNRQDEAKIFEQRAAALQQIADTAFWNASDGSFYARLDADHKGEGKAGPILLYHDLVTDGAKIKSALAGAGADVLYKYGDPDEARTKMLDTALGDKARREYPETSFTWVGTLVNGAMGITLAAPAPNDAWTKGYWVQTVLRTQSGLGSKIAWAELRHLPLRDNFLTVRHDGQTKTRVTNESGPAFIWEASFAGAHEKLIVSGKAMKALVQTDALGRQTSSVRVTVGAGGYVEVSTQ